jgi:hypothetical protein
MEDIISGMLMLLKFSQVEEFGKSEFVIIISCMIAQINQQQREL